MDKKCAPKNNKLDKSSFIEKLNEALNPDNVESSIDRIRIILDNGSYELLLLEEVYGDNQEDALTYAARIQKHEVLKMLLDYCNYDEGFGYFCEEEAESLIYQAAMYNKDPHTVALLIDDYNVTCPDVDIEFMFINFMEGHYTESGIKTFDDFYQFLTESCFFDNQTIFRSAVRANNLDFCKYLSNEQGIDLTEEDEDGQSAIHYAAKYNNPEVLKWLVEEEGIDPETMGSNGMMPIHLACDEKSDEVISMLIEDYHVDLEIPSDVGMYPVHYLARHECDDGLFKKCVTKYELNYFQEDEGGRTPLGFAIHNKNVDIVKFIVNKHIEIGDPGVQDAYEFAFRSDEFEFVQFLNEECGFDLKKEKWVELLKYKDQEREYDSTPMDIVIINGNLDIFRYCYKAHFGSNVPTIEKSHIQVACEKNAPSIVDYLLTFYDSKSYIDLLLKDKYYGVWNAFREAARLDDIDLVKYIVEKKHKTLDDDEHGSDSNFNTPLPPIHAAIRNGNFEMVKYLVDECNEDPERFSMEHGSTTLFAVKEGQLNIAEYLIENYNLSCNSLILSLMEDGRIDEAIDWIAKSKENVDDIFCAQALCNNKNTLPFLKRLAKKYKINFNFKDEEGKTPLINALIYGNLETVKWLVEKCSQDVISVNFEEKNALILAAQAENEKLVKYLVEKCHIDVNSQDADGNSALIYAVNGRNLAAEENVKIMKYLVNHGADINSTATEGQTILHFLAGNGFYSDSDSSWFIRHGANVSAKDDNGRTPLHIAAASGCLGLVHDYIVKYKANPNEVDNWGGNAAHYAAENRESDVVKWLVVNEYSSVNCKKFDNTSLLESAIIGCSDKYYRDEESSLELPKWLVENGADVITFDDDHYSPLHLAAKLGNINVVKYFVEELDVDPGLVEILPNGKKAKKPSQVAADFDDIKQYLRRKEKEYAEKKEVEYPLVATLL